MKKSRRQARVHRKDRRPLLAIFLLLLIPVTVILASQVTNFFTRAEGIKGSVEGLITQKNSTKDPLSTVAPKTKDSGESTTTDGSHMGGERLNRWFTFYPHDYWDDNNSYYDNNFDKS